LDRFGKMVQNGPKNEVQICQIRDKFCIGQFEAKTSFHHFVKLIDFVAWGTMPIGERKCYFFLRGRQKWVPYVQSIASSKHHKIRLIYYNIIISFGYCYQFVGQSGGHCI